MLTESKAIMSDIKESVTLLTSPSEDAAFAKECLDRTRALLARHKAIAALGLSPKVTSALVAIVDEFHDMNEQAFLAGGAVALGMRDMAEAIRARRPGWPVVWVDEATPFSAEDVRVLLEENERLRSETNG